MKNILIVLLLVAGSCQAGSIQKWVDENGNVHYGDNPPTSIKSETVNVSRPPSNPGKPLPRLGNLKQGVDNKNPAQPKADTRPENRLNAAEKAKAACKTARNNLDIINSSTLVRLRQADGSERLLTDQEIDVRRVRYQSDIEQYCQ